MEAVVDRLGNDFAVLLLGSDRYKVIIPLSCLPEEIGEDDIVQIDFKLCGRVKPKEKVVSILDKYNEKRNMWDKKRKRGHAPVY